MADKEVLAPRDARRRTKKLPRALAARLWRPGQSGNPSGRSGRYGEMQRLCREFSPQGAQVLIHDRNRIGEHLPGGFAVTVLVRHQLLLVVAQLIEQTTTQIAASNSGRVHLADQIKRFVQIFAAEAGLEYGLNRLFLGSGIRPQSRRFRRCSSLRPGGKSCPRSAFRGM